MLYNIDKDEQTQVPHRREYDVWINRLDPQDLQAIRDELNRIIDNSLAPGNVEVLTSSWIPGSDWTGTPYAPIWDACSQNFTHSAMCFGLILWEVMMGRDQAWVFIKQEDIAGTRYFPNTDWD
jgi:hypothetical protein